MIYLKVLAVSALIFFSHVSFAWTYGERLDKMRNVKTLFAHVASTNRVNFGFPYNGGSGLDLTLRKIGNDRASVIFTISKGQFACFDRCSFNVKFDDEDVDSYTVDTASDGSSNTMFVWKEDEFISKLMNAKHLIVEADFYKNGSRQFKFNVQKLKWIE